VSHTSSIVRPPMLASSPPPKPSSVADVGPKDTWGPSAASPLPHTKPRAHALTRKSYVANQNNMCPKPPQEDIVDDSFSSTPGPYSADGASRPTFYGHIA
jgi:hypothetical protein